MSLRKRGIDLLSAILMGALLNGCAHSIHQVHTSDFLPASPLSQGQVITAQAEKFVILGFTQDTTYVDQAYQKLIASCPNGAVSGITTQLSTSLGFFSWTHKVLMQGLCVKR
jgi:hypothetical protein